MAQPTWIGKTISDRYHIEELLGQGGMSAVYKANDPNLKRVVAIKLIHSHLAGDAQFIQRFEEEAAAVASLRHPNIVQVFDFNADDGIYYMVLEFIPGETLQDHIRRLTAQDRKVPLTQAIKLIINMCDALAYAHQRGMVHRDIKPANIMLDLYGQAILMDFGIVKIMGGTNHTATGAVVGTARYMSPEMIRAEPPDPRSDIYSLGVTLYEMLSGQAPYNADSAMTLMMMHLNDPIPDPRKLRSDIPAELVRILNKALAKDKQQRYQDVNAFGHDLRRLLTSLESQTSTSAGAMEDTQTPTIIPQPSQRAAVQNLSGAKTNIDAATVYDQRQPPATNNYTPPPPVPPGPVSGSYPQPFEPEKKRLPKWIFAVGGVVFLFVVAVLIGGVYFLSNQFGASAASGNSTQQAALAATMTQVAFLAQPTQTKQQRLLNVLHQPQPKLLPPCRPIPVFQQLLISHCRPIPPRLHCLLIMSVSTTSPLPVVIIIRLITKPSASPNSFQVCIFISFLTRYRLIRPVYPAAVPGIYTVDRVLLPDMQLTSVQPAPHKCVP